MATDCIHSKEALLPAVDRIGNFGGIEMNIMTLNTPEEVKQYVRDLLPKIEGPKNGFRR